MKISHAQILAGLLGVCVGDALGVPVEFTTREERLREPVTSMQGYGTYNQPPGTWSDDSSLTFCLAESLCQGFSLDAIAQSFCRWHDQNYWTPHGTVFDIGMTTATALRHLRWDQVSPLESGCTDEMSNGNGSLMRILPMAFYYQSLEFPELIKRVHQVSSITHAHLRSQMACGIYISIAIRLLERDDPEPAYFKGIQRIQEIYNQPPYTSELDKFARILDGEIAQFPMEAIQSGSYVVHTLEAALWCFLTSTSYAQSVLKAVNLGSDTDTTAAVTGGLAGLYYGVEQIPQEWRDQIARKDDIVDLAQGLASAIASENSTKDK
ncbi:MAG: ADP-ribosylglycohydrolase family protein [Coleofasciculus sp. G3-WIS-01]|uniref:ADP-ribosylglycohydrolase family protein n=1 Tax=Coleofasciculus sp. G3-WIS-01 TaxID=3069528 RepID=UPI0032F15531